VVNAPTLSLGLPNFGSTPLAADGWQQLIAVARQADIAGIDRIIVVDHVVMGEHLEAYAWGRFPTPPDSPWLEPLTVLTAIAAVTSRIRLGTGILIAPLRRPALLAKTAATLDVLSGGRLDLGVGTGWQKEEYDALGLDFSQRGQLLSDTLAACKALWTEVPAAVDLPTVSFRDIYCVPQPVQPGGVPLWVSGSTVKPVVDRVVSWGDGWIPIMTADLDYIRDGAALLRARFAEAGRDPSALQVRAPMPLVRDADGKIGVSASVREVPRVIDAGATDVSAQFPAVCRDPADAPQALADLVGEFNAVVAAG
jgi:probable F420-dependent oxidoreductase